MSQTALIFGVSGQDGCHLAKLLIGKGYSVHGTSRDAETNQFSGLEALGIREKVNISSASPVDFRSIIQTFHEIKPDEVYNLSGQSSVGLSFAQPAITHESIAVGTMNLLEVIRMTDKPVRFYNASSSECFGILAIIRQMKELHSCPEAPMLSRKPTHIGRYQSIGMLTTCLCVLESCSTDQPHLSGPV